ncbi:HK97 family phage prohead protease [Mangrovicoccus algicola]|uniref:HK97 family phage prohead protease n=1 Tax=Mangrovicoccus algicola TaxID=2771008 RepID=A0A8J6YTD6_9RHOB|nr:HK97 family phage prohead protease [Mangrovicoccus algicola]MBE3637472.1 HK97 family phage prohead protease [Mangrovicoccus algicola]
MDTRAFRFEIKALGEDGAVEGYAAVFGNVDGGGDRLVPGAFRAGLAKAAAEGRSIPMLWQHDPNRPIGVWTDLQEDERGLKASGQLVLEVGQAREAHALMKAGALRGLSVGYRTVRAGNDGKARLLEEVDLWEVSPVTFPMNRLAGLTAVKAEGAEAELDKLRAGDRLTEREFERLLKGSLGLSNSQAERAARVHLKGQGDPVEADETAALWAAMAG